MTVFTKLYCIKDFTNFVLRTKKDHVGLVMLGPVHTYPDLFENASFFIRFGFPSTRRRRFQSPKTKLFENALQSGSF